MSEPKVASSKSPPGASGTPYGNRMTQLQTEQDQTSARTGEKPVVIAHNLSKTFKDFWMRSRAVAVDDVEVAAARAIVVVRVEVAAV